MNKDKTRDMIRSILPSTARRRARFTKAMLNRQVRHGVRTDLHVEDLDTDLRRTPYFRSMLWDRRGADKLNHFMRWCREITAGMSTQEALDYVRALLPANLIGDHAYGHWEHYRKNLDRPRRRYRTREQNVQSYNDSMTFRLRRALTVDPSLHGRLNEEIKRRTPEEEPPHRLLAGLHDVEAFVRESWSLEREVTRELIEEIEKTKGGRKGRPSGFTGSATLSRSSRGPRARGVPRPRRAAARRDRCAAAASPRRSTTPPLRRARSSRRASRCTRRGWGG